jgi:hypothetical protein
MDASNGGATAFDRAMGGAVHGLSDGLPDTTTSGRIIENAFQRDGVVRVLGWIGLWSFDHSGVLPFFLPSDVNSLRCVAFPT